MVFRSHGVIIDSSLVIGNTAGTGGQAVKSPGVGGGINIVKSKGTVIRNTRFLRNRAQGGRNANGGGLHVECSDLLLDSCTLSENISPEFGGGIFGDGCRPLELEKTLLTKNSALLGGGGAALVSETPGENVPPSTPSPKTPAKMCCWMTCSAP